MLVYKGDELFVVRRTDSCALRQIAPILLHLMKFFCSSRHRLSRNGHGGRIQGEQLSRSWEESKVSKKAILSAVESRCEVT